MDGMHVLGSKAILFFFGLVVFLIGFKITTCHGNKVNIEDFKEDLLLEYDNRRPYKEKDNPMVGVVIGTLIMCLGAIPVGGVLLGWDNAHITSAMFSIFGN